MSKSYSSEYLEEVLAEAKKYLPGWAYASLSDAARARAGGRAAHRVDEPSTIEKLALPEIRPSKLRQVDDEELRAVWLRLSQWHASAKRRREAVEGIVNAALWVKAELQSRGSSVSASPLVAAVAELEAVKKARGEAVRGVRGALPGFLESRLDKAPDEILLVRDFVSVAGSAAVAEKPSDVDVVLRAEYDGQKGAYLLDGSGIWVALRRFLTPDKRGPQMQLLAAPQGSFTDYVPVYDLVARRREPHVVKIEPEPAEYEGKDRVVKSAEKPPEKVADAAKLGLDLREKFGRGGTEVGVARARDLSNRRAVSAETISRMRSFFARHGAQVDRRDKGWENRDDPSAQWIAWLLWGGDAGKEWAESLGKVEKQARAATSEIRTQAERAKKTDAITLGEFFYQPKPTRPAFEEEAQTVDRLLELYEERREDWLPAWVQKKYDGARHQIHKDNSAVTIYSEDGDDNTDRLPGIVEAVRKLEPHKLVLDCEIERWHNGQHLPRETVAGHLAERGEPDDSELVANVFDVLWWKGDDVHKRQLRLRLEYLRQLGTGTMDVPSKDARLNIAPGVEVGTVAELRKAVEKIRKLPGSEGIVAKQIESPYSLTGTTRDAWVKYHNATTVRGVVYASKRTRGGVWTYSYGVRPGKEQAATRVDEGLVPVGETFATGLRFQPGDAILVEVEAVNKVRQPQGVCLTAWVPRVLGGYDGEPDTVDTAAKRAADDLVLQCKEADEAGAVETYYAPNVVKSLGRVDVPTVGPQTARVVFVAASPGRIEAARREPLAGPSGETFGEVYLGPLGLKRAEVAITNAVPQLLTDEHGRVREPTPEEVDDWREWLGEQLDGRKAEIVIALGKTAETALGKRADVMVPHPAAVRRFGDSGEVARKLKRIRERLDREAKVAKRLPAVLAKAKSEGGTRSAAAVDNWDKNWWKMLPRSGEGRFTYQHHWRGLEEDEIGLSDADLMKTDHSVHGDLRLEGNGDLWGFTIFLGETKDNRGPNLDKLIDWKADDNIEVSPKLPQPREWLDVGADKPYVSPPGEVGATSEKYSKFFRRDHGTYQLGVARKHSVEIFLDGENLKGRYLLVYAPVAGRRLWLIDKPDDQTPMAESRDLADLIGELRRKNQSHLVWGKPGEKPRIIEVKTGKVLKESTWVGIAKADEAKRIVYGIAMDPYGERGPTPDADNDWPTPAGVEKAAHRWLKGSRVIGFEHRKPANAQVVESWVEQYPSRKDYLAAMGELPHRVYRRKFGDDVIHSGSWLLGVELGEKEWAMYKRGEINAFSPGGMSVRVPIDRSQMPEVTFVDIVEKPVT